MATLQVSCFYITKKVKANLHSVIAQEIYQQETSSQSPHATKAS